MDHPPGDQGFEAEVGATRAAGVRAGRQLRSESQRIGERPSVELFQPFAQVFQRHSGTIVQLRAAFGGFEEFFEGDGNRSVLGGGDEGVLPGGHSQLQSLLLR